MCRYCILTDPIGAAGDRSSSTKRLCTVDTTVGFVHIERGFCEQIRDAAAVSRISVSDLITRAVHREVELIEGVYPEALRALRDQRRRARERPREGA